MIAPPPALGMRLSLPLVEQPSDLVLSSPLGIVRRSLRPYPKARSIPVQPLYLALPFSDLRFALFLCLSLGNFPQPDVLLFTLPCIGLEKDLIVCLALSLFQRCEKFVVLIPMV